jgi:metal-sulfur cluster biosynthetic enzyme
MSFRTRLTEWLSPSDPPAAPAPEAGPLLDAIRTVIDPEIGIDIVSMGLIRGIAVQGDLAIVQMTLSTRGCPVGPALMAQVVDALNSIGQKAEVELTFDPPWTPADITPEGRAALGR